MNLAVQQKDITKMSRDEIRDLIGELEIVTKKEEQVEVPIWHYFSKGVYAREMFAKKGTFIVGKIHKFQNLNIISKGEVSILSIEGVKHLKAPSTFVSVPGVKRVIFVHEDCVWTTIHGTNETDLEKIEEEVIVKSYAELEG